MGTWEDDMLLFHRLSELVRNSYKQSEILEVISSEFGEYSWSIRTLQRRLRKFDLKRNDTEVDPAALLQIVKEESSGTGGLLGYRALHRKIRNQHGMLVARNDVYLAMNIVCPEKLEARRLINKRKRFHKRQFVSNGPNWVWSMDGHDKLCGQNKSEFPFGIHGCIDSFSRKILWLKIWPSNCNPELPARLYLDAIIKFGYAPAKTRSDRGSENVIVAAMQNFLTRPEQNQSNHIFGSSITNQVIEQWWRGFRERHGEFFKVQIYELVSCGLYNEGDSTCRVIIAYLFIPLIQQELNQFAENWNTHRIRKQDIYRPCGIPNFLYHYPDCNGGSQFGVAVKPKQVQFLEKEISLTQMHFISKELAEKFQQALGSVGFGVITITNAKEAYAFLLSEFGGKLLQFCYS